jgi:hypothetical protein
VAIQITFRRAERSEEQLKVIFKTLLVGEDELRVVTRDIPAWVARRSV